MYFLHGEPPYDTLKDVKNDFSNALRAQVQSSMKERKARGRFSDHTITAFGGEAYWRQSAGIFLFYLHFPPPPEEWLNPAADYLSSLEFKHLLLKRSGLEGATIADLHWAWGKLYSDKKKPVEGRQYAHAFFLPYASWVQDAVRDHHGILPDGRKAAKKY